jgi:hypothetical protein
MDALIERLRHPLRSAEAETCAVCHEPSRKWTDRWVAQERYRLCCGECVAKFDARPAVYIH